MATARTLQQRHTQANRQLAIIRTEMRRLPTNVLFILVEGESDYLVYSDIFSSEKTKVYEFKGKPFVEKSLQLLLSEQYKQVIAILDADFFHLEVDANIPQHTFYTDYHDIEMMMFKPLLKRLIQDYISPQQDCYQYFIENLAQDILNCIIQIGYIRWFNEQQQAGFYFDNFIKDKLIQFNACHISISENDLFKAFLKYKDNQEKLNVLNLNTDTFKQNISILQKQSTDAWQIACGHDATLLLAKIIDKYKKKGFGNKNQKDIELTLCQCFHQQHFQQTKLYQNLKSWVNTHHFQLFDEEYS